MVVEKTVRRAAPLLFLLAACSESAGNDASGSGGSGMAGGASDDVSVVSSTWTVEGGTFLDAPAKSQLFTVMPDGRDDWVVQIAALTSAGGGKVEVRRWREGEWRTIGSSTSAGDLALVGESIYRVELALDGTTFSLGQFQGEPAELVSLGMSSAGEPITRVNPFGLRGELYVIVQYTGAHTAIQRWDGAGFETVDDTLQAGLEIPFARSVVTSDDDTALIELRLAGGASDAPAAALRFDGEQLTFLEIASAGDQRWELPRYCRLGGVDYVLHDAGEHSVLERLEAGARTPVMKSADGSWWLGRTCSRSHLFFTEYAENKPALAPRGLRAFDGTRLFSLPTEHDLGRYAEPVLTTLYPPPPVAFAGAHAGAFHYWLDVTTGTGRIDSMRSYHLTRPTF